jgi:hypothetical protein
MAPILPVTIFRRHFRKIENHLAERLREDLFIRHL